MRLRYRVVYTVSVGDFYGEDETHVESGDQIFDDPDPAAARAAAVALLAGLQEKYRIPWHTWAHLYLLADEEQIALGRGWRLPESGYFPEALDREARLLAAQS